MTTRPVRAIRAAVVGGAVLGVALVTVVAGAASAHVEPDPAAAPGGVTNIAAVAGSHGQTAASSSVTDTGLDTIAGEGGKKRSDNKALLIGGVVAAAVVIAGGLALTRLRQRDDER